MGRVGFLDHFAALHWRYSEKVPGLHLTTFVGV